MLALKLYTSTHNSTQIADTTVNEVNAVTNVPIVQPPL